MLCALRKYCRVQIYRTDTDVARLERGAFGDVFFHSFTYLTHTCTVTVLHRGEAPGVIR